jgi:hypothetical protein
MVLILGIGYPQGDTTLGVSRAFLIYLSALFKVGRGLVRYFFGMGQGGLFRGYFAISGVFMVVIRGEVVVNCVVKMVR